MSLQHFRSPIGLLKSWFQAKGFDGSPYDSAIGYFQSKSGLSEGTLYDHIMKTLEDNGFSGTIDDRLSSFFISKMSIADRRDAERSFFKDTSQDFSGGSSFTIDDEGGNPITDESGNPITYQ